MDSNQAVGDRRSPRAGSSRWTGRGGCRSTVMARGSGVASSFGAGRKVGCRPGSLCGNARPQLVRLATLEAAR